MLPYLGCVLQINCCLICITFFDTDKEAVIHAFEEPTPILEGQKLDMYHIFLGGNGKKFVIRWMYVTFICEPTWKVKNLICDVEQLLW